jgi:uncharacterized protein DUF3592
MTQRGSTGTAGKIVGGVFGCLFGAVWVLGWSAVTLTFDVIWVKSLVGQVRAESYPTAAGTILSSRVHESSDSEGGSSYSAKIRYAYDVGGRRYECDRYRYGVMWSGRRRAQSVAASYPAGRSVSVHYNPANPADAVLRPGLEAGDFFLPLFMTPFNLIMLASWVVLALVMASPVIKTLPAGVKVRHEGMNLRVRPDGFPPLAAAAVAAGAAAFVCVFPVAIAGGPDAPPWVIFAGWAVVLAAAVFMYLRSALPQWAGHIDLVIDPWRKTLTLPRTHGRRESICVALSDVTAVEVQHRKTTDADGDVNHTYLPTLQWKDPAGGGRHSGVIASWGDEGRAQRFAAWLRERVGVKAGAATV